MNFLNFFWRFMTARAARIDSGHGVDAKDRRMTAALGLSPADVEKSTYEYQRAVQDASDTSQVEELRDEIRRAVDLRGLVGTPFIYTVGLVLIWIVEFAGALLILKSLGIPAAHRVLPALALTAALIGLTHVTVKVTASRAPLFPPNDPNSGGESDASAAEVAPSGEQLDWRRFLFPLVFGVLVGAIALVRVFGSNADEVPPIVAWSEAILMIAISVGPAFAATWVETQRAPAVELDRRIRTLEGRLRQEERRIKRADRLLASVDRRTAEWTKEMARRRAIYSTEHELARANERLRIEVENTRDTRDDETSSR